MAENKNYVAEEKNCDLKQVDSKKSNGIDTESYQAAMKEVNGEKIGKDFLVNRSSRIKNKHLPVFVDIAIGILILAIAVGIILGSFFLFRYYSDDYGEENIEYVFVTRSTEDQSVYLIMKNRDLFLDTEDNSFYFGKITNVEIFENEDNIYTVIFTVNVKAKYKHGSGYLIGDERIAVGSEYTSRVDTLSVNGAVVELIKRSN